LFKRERYGGRAIKIWSLLKSPIRKRGETMTTHITGDARYSMCARAQRKQDILLASSFGLWAGVLGLGPVLAFRLLAGS